MACAKPTSRLRVKISSQLKTGLTSKKQKGLRRKGLLAFPGVVDAHMHTGIYAPLAEDAVSESRAAAPGRRDFEPQLFPQRPVLSQQGGPYRSSFRKY